jgi:4,5-DOPA dioxygenase extradiol
MKINDIGKETVQKNNGEKMPVLFVGHGSPMNAIEENEFVTGWHNIAKTLPPPSAIICISAHWETNGTFITAMDNPRTIHDFGGFPRQLYEVQYKAPGSPSLAAGTKSLISSTDTVLDNTWGLDHGAWSVIRHLYPLADVPVIELSLDYHKLPRAHFELARELAPLRRQGVLIIGSGNMVHNLGLVSWERMNEVGFGFDWAVAANEKMKQFIFKGDFKSLIDYKLQGSEFNMAIPTPDHFLPLLYALALKEEDEPVSLFNDKPVAGSLTMTSVRIGE